MDSTGREKDKTVLFQEYRSAWNHFNVQSFKHWTYSSKTICFHSTTPVKHLFQRDTATDHHPDQLPPWILLQNLLVKKQKSSLGKQWGLVIGTHSRLIHSSGWQLSGRLNMLLLSHTQEKSIQMYHKFHSTSSSFGWHYDIAEEGATIYIINMIKRWQTMQEI